MRSFELPTFLRRRLRTVAPVLVWSFRWDFGGERPGDLEAGVPGEIGRKRAGAGLARPLDLAEQAVGLVVDPGGEEERVARPGHWIARPEHDRPQAIDDDRLVMLVLELVD